VKLGKRLLAAWYDLHYWGGLFFFGLGIVLLQMLSVVGLILPGGPRLRRLSQGLVRQYLRGYLQYLRTTGAMRSFFDGWDEERFSKQPGVIVANHPSMLDAPLLLSRLPRGICIFKAALGRNVMRGRAATVTGYMHSEEGVDGLRAVSQAVRQGSQFVFFPEGTRTPPTGPVTLHPLYAVVAKYARVPIHIFAMERDTNALCKDHARRRPPILPARFRVRYVQSVSPDVEPTAALLHACVAKLLMPIIEAYRQPSTEGLFAWRTVVEETAERVEWTLRMPSGEAFFAGHFPGHPIAPGAASLHWIGRAWEAGPGRGQGLPRFQRVRFQREIQPADELRLVIERRPAMGWKATLATSEGPVTSATIEPAPVS